MDFVAKHREAAHELYRRRVRMLNTGRGDSALLQKMERRMRVALAGVTPAQGESQNPRDAVSAFVIYASRIVNETDHANLQALYEEAFTLLEAGGDIAEGLFDVLLLYPPADVDWMIAKYREQPTIGVHLFRLWQSQGAILPAGLVNQAELQSQDAALQQSALYFAADSPHYGNEIFSAYYRNGMAAHLGTSIAEAVLVPALWGGLVRGDTEAYISLRNAVEQVSDLEVRHDLLRLLALAGREEDLPVLLSYVGRDPDRGYPLLALFGRPAVVPSILHGLETANSLQAAYVAWLMLTNLPLPMRPRLMLVDEYQESAPDADASTEMEMIPDVTIARKWWEVQQQHWPSNSRRFAGVDLTRENLSQAITECIGVAASDLIALLVLELKRPLEIGSGWETQRQKRIRKLLNDQTAPVTHQQQVR